MGKRLVGLYSCMLAWLPQGFREEFAEEMMQVFAARVREARSCGNREVFWTFIKELRALPALWLLAYQRERRLSSMKTYSSSAAPDDRSSWGAVLAATLPLVGFVCLFAMAGVARRLLGAIHLDVLFRLLWADALRIAAMPIVFYLLLLGGLLAAWLKDFPRWSYPYLGWLLVLLVPSLGSFGLHPPYLWRFWGPLLVTLLLAILLRPSLKPLRALWHGWQQDWTLSVFAVLGIVEFLNLFDEIPGPRAAWQSVCTAVLVVGAIAYMRISSRAGRVAALLGSMVVSVALGATVRAYYWHGLADSVVGWAAWFVVLMAPALFSAALRRLRPSRSAGQ